MVVVRNGRLRPRRAQRPFRLAAGPGLGYGHRGARHDRGGVLPGREPHGPAGAWGEEALRPAREDHPGAADMGAALGLPNYRRIHPRAGLRDVLADPGRLKHLGGQTLVFTGLESPPHLIIVLVVVLLLFGAKRIPELARGLGAGVREFKKGAEGDGAR